MQNEIWPSELNAREKVSLLYNTLRKVLIPLEWTLRNGESGNFKGIRV